MTRQLVRGERQYARVSVSTFILPYSKVRTSALLLSAALVLGGCQPQPTVRIGFIGGLSDRYADLGSPAKHAVELAVAERNAAGGINGRTIELWSRDDFQDESIAKEAFQDLVQLGVAGIVGPMTSSMAVTLAPLADAAQRVIISPTAVTSELSGRDDHFFRVLASADEYAAEAARHHHGILGRRQAAIAIDTANHNYTKNWATHYKEAFEREGGRVSTITSFSSVGDKNYEQIASQLVADSPDIVILVSSSVDASLIAEKVRGKLPDIQIAGSAWTATEQLVRLGGPAVEGMQVEQFFDRHDKSARYTHFVSSYQTRYGQPPGFAAVTAYDAATILLDALQKNPDHASVKSTLLTKQSYQGVQQAITFDAYGDTHRPSYRNVIKGGRYVRAE